MSLLNFDQKFESVKSRLLNAIESVFPIEGKLHTIKLKKVWVEDKLSIKDYPSQKKARLKGGDWAVPVYASFDLLDNVTGKVIDRENKFKVAALPKMTDRGSFIVRGNEYQVQNVLRLKPGAYTRIQENGALETQVNLARGRNFKLLLDPRTGIFTMRVGTANVKLYPIITGLGVDNAKLESVWGKDLTTKNAKGRYDEEIMKAHKAFFGKPAMSTAEAIANIAGYFDNDTEISEETTRKTLGTPFSKVSGDMLLATSQKILNVTRGETLPDQRDSMEFKTVHDIEDLLSERIEKNAIKLGFGVRRNLDRRDEIKYIVSANTFGSHVDTFFTGSDEYAAVSSVTPQTNPVSMLGETNKMTILGPGGISSLQSVTMDARNVHPTSFGFIDGVHTPESGKIGTTFHMATSAMKKGTDLQTTVVDVKTGKRKFLTSSEAALSVISFRDQYDVKDKKLKAKSLKVKAIAKGKLGEVNSKDVEYIFPSSKGFFDVSTNLIPFLANDQGNRAMMASKMLEQALPLKYRESPLVQSEAAKGRTFEDVIGSAFTARASEEGTVTKVTKDNISIKNKSGKVHQVQLYDRYPLNTHVYMQSYPTVKVGDSVKADQLIADSNYTQNGTLAIGTNLNVGYVPMKGYNYEDGILISDAAAHKLTSLHKHEYSIDIDPETLLNLKKFRAYHPGVIDESAAGKLDEDGVIKVGQKVNYNDVVIAGLKKETASHEAEMLRKLHRGFVKPYRDVALHWKDEDEGVVIEVVKGAKKVTVYITTEEKAKVGDKLSNRHGGKGTITKVMPDAEMPRDVEGNPIDIALNPIGIPSRINIGQSLETAAGKLAAKAGKPFVVNNFSGEDYLDKIKKELKAKGISDTENLFDPSLNRNIPNVMVGRQYILKLDHPTRKKFSARSRGGYTLDMTPSRGGGEGGQSIGKMEMAALMAAGAKHNLREMATIKSEANDEFWRALQMGQPLPAPRIPFAVEKLEAMIKGSGVDIYKDGSKLQLTPMTDQQIKAMSNGEIKDALAIRGKDLKPEKGGIFDPVVTGGVGGSHWNHVVLSEPTPNPAFETPIRELLGITEVEYRDYVNGDRWVDSTGKIVDRKIRGAKTGGAALKILLSQIDVDREARLLKARASGLKGSELNKAHRKLRYLKALKEKGQDPTIYILNNFPVIPAAFRPIYSMPDGSLGVSQVNELYKDMILVNNQLKIKELPEDLKGNLRRDLYDGLKGVAGLGSSLSGRQRKGLIEQITGDQPKTGYFQSKIMGRRQDFTGRSTIIPEPTLGLDETMIPEAMAWKLYEPFVIRELVMLGKTPLQAKEHLDNRDDTAKKALELAMQDRPVLMNRAPTLHKFSIMGFIPKLTSGKAIKTNPLINEGFNLDHDGDYQLNSVLTHLSPECIILASDLYGAQYLEERRMSARFKAVVPAVDDDGGAFCFDLEDFPHGDLIKTTVGKNGPIEWYRAITGTKVLAYNDRSGGVSWEEVSIWSVHFDRKVEIVNLKSGRQIITDDDPRAVYGIEMGSLKVVRNTPSDALASEMFVPKCDRLNLPVNISSIDSQDHCNSARAHQLKSNISLDANTGYYFGASCGDGWVTKTRDELKGVCLAGVSEEVQLRFTHCVEELFNGVTPEPTIVEGKDSYGKSIKYTYSSKNLAVLTEPLIGSGARQKHLPAFFMSAPKEFREGLFAGLIDTDGTISIVKAKAKKNPQLQGAFFTTSIRLAREVRLLASTLDIKGRITVGKTPAGEPAWLVSFSNMDIIKWGGKYMAHKEKLQKLSEASPIKYTGPAAKSDITPISFSLAEFIQKQIPMPRNAPREQKSLYCVINQSKNKGSTSRMAAKRVIDFVGRSVVLKHTDGQTWLNMVDNENVSWDQVVSIEKTSMIETGYDLTVPGYETFMNVDGIILSNTMGVHVPITEEARKEAFKLLPSANLYSVKDGSLMNLPRHEQLLGLYLMTKDGKSTRKSYNTLAAAKQAYDKREIGVTDTIKIGGKRLSLGRALVNSAFPAGYQDVKATFSKKSLRVKLEKLSKESPQRFAQTVGKLKDLGNKYSYESGFTVSLSDLDVDYKYRDKIFAEAERKSKKIGTIKAYTEATKKLDTWLNKELGVKQNSFFTMMESGAKGNSGQIRQMVGAPVLVKDINDRTVPYPIKKSYAEGLPIADYLSSMAGARKGMVDRALMTAQPGAFSKEYMSSGISERITMNDCGTFNGLTMKVDNPDAADRYLARGVAGIAKRGDLVTPALLTRMRGKVSSISVRSPSTCEAPDGMCQMCYGLDEHGQKVEMGRNVGLLAAQAITEPMTNMSMRSFHSGGIAGTKKDPAAGTLGGFERVKELLEMHENVRGKASLAEANGTVEKLEESPTGGWNVTIGKQEHFIEPGRDPLIRMGQDLKRGDVLSTGAIKPQELVQLKGVGPVRDYLIQSLNNEYKEQGIKVNQKIFETAIRPLVNNAQVMESGSSKFSSGDFASISAIDHFNRGKDKSDQIKYNPMMKGVNTYPLVSEDWLARLNYRRLKEAITQGGAQGWKSDIMSSPVGSYAYGIFFGKDKEKRAEDGPKNVYEDGGEPDGSEDPELQSIEEW